MMLMHRALRGGNPVAAGDVTAPTLSSATIDSAGTSLTLAFNESVSIGAGGNAGWTVSLSGGAATVSYASGSGSSSLVYTLSRTVNSGETGTVSYTQPGNGVEDASGNDLANVSSSSITNNSSQGGGSLPTFLRESTFEFGTAGTDATSSTDGFNENNTGVISTTRSYAGTRSADCPVTIGQTAMGGNIILPSSTNGGVIAIDDEVWCRFRAWIPSTYSISTGDSGMKFFRLRAYIDGGVPAGSNTIQLWGAGPQPSGLRTEAEGFTPDTRTFDPASGWVDRWVTFEIYAQLSRTTNGILRTYVDGTLRGEVTGVDIVGTSSPLNYYFMFLDFYNNGAPQTQSIWIDDIQIAHSGTDSPTNSDGNGNFYIGMS